MFLIDDMIENVVYELNKYGSEQMEIAQKIPKEEMARLLESTSLWE